MSGREKMVNTRLVTYKLTQIQPQYFTSIWDGWRIHWRYEDSKGMGSEGETPEKVLDNPRPALKKFLRV